MDTNDGTEPVDGGTLKAGMPAWTVATIAVAMAMAGVAVGFMVSAIGAHHDAPPPDRALASAAPAGTTGRNDAVGEDPDAATADATAAPASASDAPAPPPRRWPDRLVDALATRSDAVGAAATERNDALAELRAKRPEAALPALTRAWFEAAQEPIRRDAVTAALWAAAPANWLAPAAIGERTVAMLATAERDERAWWRAGSDENEMLRFLVRQLALERTRRERPVAAAVRTMATFGSGRARFVAMAALASARDRRDTPMIVDYLGPHMLDNDITRDAKFAAVVLAEVAAHDGDPVRALVARPEPQLHDVALNAMQMRTRPMSVEGSRAVEPLPYAPDRAIDEVHGAWQPAPTSTLEPFERLTLTFRAPPLRFAMGSSELVFLGDPPAPGSGPYEAVQVVEGLRRITLPVGHAVRPALPPHLGEPVDLDRSTIGDEFARATFRARDGSCVAAFRIDRGAADGLAWDLLVVPMIEDRLATGLLRTFAGGSLVAGDDLRVTTCDPRGHQAKGGSGAADPDARTYRWDGRGWVDVALEATERPATPEVPAAGAAPVG